MTCGIRRQRCEEGERWGERGVLDAPTSPGWGTFQRGLGARGAACWASKTVQPAARASERARRELEREGEQSLEIRCRAGHHRTRRDRGCAPKWGSGNQERRRARLEPNSGGQGGETVARPDEEGVEEVVSRGGAPRSRSAMNQPPRSTLDLELPISRSRACTQARPSPCPQATGPRH